jgi:hypothetical protein
VLGCGPGGLRNFNSHTWADPTSCLLLAAAHLYTAFGCLQVGVDTDGGPGLGWANDEANSEQFAYDDKLREAINGGCAIQ